MKISYRIIYKCDSLFLLLRCSKAIKHVSGNDSMKYEYDKSGNICKIFENGTLAVRYEYDSID